MLDEGLTLLMRRSGRPEVSRDFAAFFMVDETHPPPLTRHQVISDQVDRAVDLYFERYRRQLSLTDRVLIVLSRYLDATVASFDAGFDGIVPRLPQASS